MSDYGLALKARQRFLNREKGGERRSLKSTKDYEEKQGTKCKAFPERQQQFDITESSQSGEDNHEFHFGKD